MSESMAHASNDPVRRLLERIAAGENNAFGDAGAITPELAQRWLKVADELDLVHKVEAEYNRLMKAAIHHAEECTVQALLEYGNNVDDPKE